jgi:hypothetical protein
MNLSTQITNEVASIPAHLDIHFYADYGHGWGEVENSLLKQLGIADDISHYSYTKGEFAYLEEDRDLSIFCKKLTSLGIGFSFIEHNEDIAQSPIRNYQSYWSNWSN